MIRDGDKVVSAGKGRTTIRLGRPITVEEVERVIEEVMDECCRDFAP
ncbi:MAG: hypothetical protein ACP5GZ_03365 [Vulcanisaeta sp.]|jgi:hypothetical protein